MTDGTIAPEQIIINGQEYSPEDATQLIELGSKYKKMESELNTSLDKVYPKFTKTTQDLADREKELAELKAENERIKADKAREQQNAMPDDIKKIRAAAREVGLADEDYLNEKGYVRKEDLDKYFEEKQNLQKAAETVLQQANKLEREIDGSDGRQPFNSDAVMAYAYVNNISDLQDAYDKMNDKFNAKWKQEQIDARQRPGLTTLTPGGKKEPQKPKYTNDNLGQALGEWIDSIPE